MLVSGFEHEHQRYDRDNYVKINFENIKEGAEDNFLKREEKYSETFEKNLISRTPYDYCSVMHYHEDAGAKPGFGPTIEPFWSFDQLECRYIGQRKRLSKWDWKKINLLYSLECILP